MPRLTLSYRREDSSAAARLIFERLRTRYGSESVFMDIDSIELGEDFRERIRHALRQTDYLLVLIGPRWLGPTGDRNRIKDVDDPVRMEVEWALETGLRVVPILLEHTPMPGPDDLPESLSKLPFINAADITTGREFDSQIERIIRFVDRTFIETDAHRTRETAAQLAAVAGAESALDRHPHNLPLQISSFVGRTNELAALSDLMQNHRLVTIVGPGGIGKTRISLQLAMEVLNRFPDGAWIVELAPLNDGKLIAQTIGDTFRLQEEPHQTIDDQLLDFLHSKKLLLLLDNSEHVLTETAALAKRLLSHCSGLVIVTTSREPLHVTGEHVFRLPPLGLTPADGRGDGQPAESVQLFIDRAQAVRPETSLALGDRELAARICSKLEGIPLAIELAAARAATLSLAQIEERLADRFAILTSKDRTRSERQRTLRATIDWSFRLLSLPERRFAREVAIFNGGFTLEGAEAVTENPAVAVDLLESLVNKSLLAVQRVAEKHRYTFFDTVQQYLVAEIPADEADPLPGRHFAYYVSLARGQVERTTAEQHGDWIQRVGYEIVNVRAALEWGVSRLPNDSGRLVIDLCRYWQVRGHISEGSAWLERALAPTDLDPSVRGALLRRAATFAAIRSDYPAARTFCADAMKAFQRAGEPGGVAEATFTLAIIDQSTGDIPAATEHYLAALAGFRATGNIDAQLRAVFNLALIAQSNNDFEWAEALLEQNADIEHSSSDADLGADLTRLRGYLDLRRGRLAEAAAAYERALGTKRAIGSRFDSAEILNDLATVHFRSGDVERAALAAQESLRIALDIDAAPLIIVGFEAFAEIALARADYADAARYLAFAAQLRDQHNYRHPGDRDLQSIADEIGRLGPEEINGVTSASDSWKDAVLDLTR